MRTPDQPSPSARRWRLLARISLSGGLLIAAAALLAGPSYRSGLLTLGTSIQTLRVSAMLAMLAATLALLALVGLLVIGQRRGIRTATLALVVNLLVVAPPLLMLRLAAGVPPIHDISTDTTDPPRFVDILPLRRTAPNGSEYPPQNALLQREAYPDITSVGLAAPPVASFDRAARAAAAMGWQIVTVEPKEMRIEATATTFWYGFKDDVVIRVSPDGEGSRIDVRSTSRVGRSDLGTNARRIRDYIEQLKRG